MKESNILQELCEEFALAPIRTNDQHREALRVFKRLSVRVLSEEELSEQELKTTNKYLEILGILISVYEESVYGSET